MSTTFSKTKGGTCPLEQDFSSNASTVLKDRYLARDDDGRVIETATDMLRRVAHVVAAPEETWGLSAEEHALIEHDLYQLMASKVFLPNSTTLMNAGRPLKMLSACFVLPLGDSIPEIMERPNRSRGSSPM